MITVVLMESENAGNIGAIARAMSNFGVSKLILLGPKADHLSKEAQDRAKYAKGILEKARCIAPSHFFKHEKNRFDLLVGTSAKTGTSYNLKRNPLTPKQFADQLLTLDPQKNVALLLGREGIGLTNAEIAQCDLLLTIPAHEEYSVLNVSAAATCILYEIFAAQITHGLENHSMKHLAPPTKPEREQMINLALHAIDSLDFVTPQKYETQRILWRKLLGKTVISRREAYALMGFFRKMQPRSKKSKPQK